MASMKPTRMSGSKSGIPSANTALTAVALQDHLSCSLSLQDPFRKKKINHSLPPAAKSHSKVGNHVKRNKNVVKSQEDVETKEYALDPKPPRLTLAQKLGLVEAPEQLLTDKEWKHLKEKSNARQDSSQPCVICKEDFGLCQQVLLSCSHVFHRACLEAFERFSGRKSCPMCRKEQYQRRIIHEGAKEYRIKCATRIQAAWRGYIVRQWYEKLRQTVPPKDKKLRKKFYENKLQSITDRLVHAMEVSCQTVDSFLSEIDESIARNRHTMRQLDGANIEVMGEEDWEKVQLKALERCVTDCPICIMPLTDQGLYMENHPSRPTVLLSCSHVFHATCLEAFEEFSLETGRVCPVCRSLYQKKML